VIHDSGEELRSGGGVGIESMMRIVGSVGVDRERGRYLQTPGQRRECFCADMRCGEQFGRCLQRFMGESRELPGVLKGVFDCLATRALSRCFATLA
jgi:hypothetical protein